MSPPVTFSFLFKTVLTILGTFYIHKNFRISLSISVKKPTGISIGSALTLYISLRSIIISTISSVPIDVHGMSLHLFRPSLITFNSFCSYQYISLNTTFVKFISN